MSKRHYADWIAAYLERTSYLEAPKRMHFWVAVSTIAGVLRRRTWIGGRDIVWHPNFYVILVAPPGVVAKSTTAGVGVSLLKQVPGIKFGPDIVTWQSLVSAFSATTEIFEYKENMYTQSPMTIHSSEFGNLFNPQDREMADLFVKLYDGESIVKETKTSGTDCIENPCLNLIACTTPSWVAGNFPEYLIGGGLCSRIMFVYAEEKAQYCAHPWLHEYKGIEEIDQKLIEDLEYISINLCGQYHLSIEAEAYGEAWYQSLHKNRPMHLDDARFGGYVARKQMHVYKLAQVLSAATSDSMVISKETLATAVEMVTDLEADMDKVFSKIGKTEASNHAERMIWFVKRSGTCRYSDLYRFMYSYFPGNREFEDIVAGAVRSGFLKMEQRGMEMWLVATEKALDS